MEIQKRILIVDFCNYDDYPIGGYLSFAKSLMESFGNELALTGITTCKEDPVGRWFKKSINGIVYDFFAMARYNKSKTRHLIPDRLVGYLLARYFRNRILSNKIENIFLQRQEMLLAIGRSNPLNICYCFAGLENPLSISKYQFASKISSQFERVFFKRLKSVTTVLASGDDEAIREMIARSNGALSVKQVVKFPTRINTAVFKPLNRDEVRQTLKIEDSSKVLVTTGRLAPLKGWKFMIDCFLKFEKSYANSLFYIIGEGEDRDNLQDYIYTNNLAGKAILTGKKRPEEIAQFLNASDLFIMGSYKEGWSTSLIEAIACGTPVCVTNFSSAKEIVSEGISGFVINDHNVDLFVEAMTKALQIPRPVPNNNVRMLSSDRLKMDLLKNWKIS